jgi:hypothetical protein
VSFPRVIGCASSDDASESQGAPSMAFVRVEKLGGFGMQPPGKRRDVAVAGVWRPAVRLSASAGRAFEMGAHEVRPPMGRALTNVRSTSTPAIR